MGGLVLPTKDDLCSPSLLPRPPVTPRLPTRQLRHLPVRARSYSTPVCATGPLGAAPSLAASGEGVWVRLATSYAFPGALPLPFQHHLSRRLVVVRPTLVGTLPPAHEATPARHPCPPSAGLAVAGGSTSTPLQRTLVAFRSESVVAAWLFHLRPSRSAPAVGVVALAVPRWARSSAPAYWGLSAALHLPSPSAAVWG